MFKISNNLPKVNGEKMNKIAIDARPLSQKLTGIGRYTYNLLKEILAQDKNSLFFLYSDGKLLFDFDSYDNVKVRVYNSKNNITSTIVSQLLFPYWMKKDEITHFWSPRHHLPLIVHFFKHINTTVTVHDIVWKRHPETMPVTRRMLESLLFVPSIKIATNIISISEFTKTEINYFFKIDSKKLFVTPLKSFIKTPRNTVEIVDKMILFVGTLEPRKNLPNLLTAFKKLIHTPRFSEYKLVVVGMNGWGEVELATKISELDIVSHVTITGYITDDEVINYYQRCYILAMPSIYEGFGLPALEALSFNKKVIVSKNCAVANMPGDNIFVTDIHAEKIYQTLLSAIASTPKNHAKVDSDWGEISRKTLSIIKGEYSSTPKNRKS